MRKITPEYKQSRLDHLREVLSENPNLVIIKQGVVERGNSRSRFYKVFYIGSYDDRGPVLMRLTWDVAVACGFRYNETRDAISVSGGGYSGPDHIVDRMSYDVFDDLRTFNVQEI